MTGFLTTSAIEQCEPAHHQWLGSSPRLPLNSVRRHTTNDWVPRHVCHWTVWAGTPPMTGFLATSAIEQCEPAHHQWQGSSPRLPLNCVSRHTTTNDWVPRHVYHWTVWAGTPPPMTGFLATSTIEQCEPTHHQWLGSSPRLPLNSVSRHTTNDWVPRHVCHWTVWAGTPPMTGFFATSTIELCEPAHHQWLGSSPRLPLNCVSRHTTNDWVPRHVYHWTVWAGTPPMTGFFATSIIELCEPAHHQWLGSSPRLPLNCVSRHTTNDWVPRHVYHWTVWAGTPPMTGFFATSAIELCEPAHHQWLGSSPRLPLNCVSRHTTNDWVLRHVYHWTVWAGTPPMTGFLATSTIEQCEPAHHQWLQKNIVLHRQGRFLATSTIEQYEPAHHQWLQKNIVLHRQGRFLATSTIELCETAHHQWLQKNIVLHRQGRFFATSTIEQCEPAHHQWLGSSPRLPLNSVSRHTTNDWVPRHVYHWTVWAGTPPMTGFLATSTIEQCEPAHHQWLGSSPRLPLNCVSRHTTNDWVPHHIYHWTVWAGTPPMTAEEHSSPQTGPVPRHVYHWTVWDGTPPMTGFLATSTIEQCEPAHHQWLQKNIVLHRQSRFLATSTIEQCEPAHHQWLGSSPRLPLNCVSRHTTNDWVPRHVYHWTVWDGTPPMTGFLATSTIEQCEPAHHQWLQKNIVLHRQSRFLATSTTEQCEPAHHQWLGSSPRLPLNSVSRHTTNDCRRT